MMSRSIIQISRVGLISMLTRSYATRSPFWQFYEWQKMRSQQPLKNEYEEEFLKVFPSGIVYLPKEDGRSEFNEEEKKVLKRYFKSYPQRCGMFSIKACYCVINLVALNH